MVLISIIPTKKHALLQIKKNSFCLLRIIFQNSQNFYDKMLVRSKFVPQFVEKIEKFKLSLSKQHNKMLKMRSEMLKSRKKKAKQLSSRKITGKFFENFPFPGKLKFGKKGKP